LWTYYAMLFLNDPYVYKHDEGFRFLLAVLESITKSAS
jgi:hypothetical protein